MCDLCLQAKQAETDDQEALKRRLEEQFIPSALAILNRIARDWASVYSVTGDTISIDAYLSDITSLLSQHYTSVSRVFEGVASEDLGQEVTTQSGNVQAPASIRPELNAAMIEWIRERAPDQAQFIAETTYKTIETEIQSATQQLEGEGIEPTALLLAPLVRRALLERNIGRVETIAMFETQNVAEMQKLAEVRALTGQQPIEGVSVPAPDSAPLDGVTTFKTWRTVGDGKVRPEHRRAGGQKVDVNDSFSVGGQKMKYPSDTSLGASLSNTINCRCTARFSVDRSTLPRAA